MTCDEAELELVTLESNQKPAPPVLEHLSGCDRCRVFQSSSAQLLADAALSDPSGEEKAAQQGLAPRVHQQWRQLERRRSFARRVVALALAACVGAVVASAALIPRLEQTTTPSEVPEFSVNEPELVSSVDTEDELETLEVSWPSP